MSTIPDEITNNEDIIDTRDILRRIEYLQSERDIFQEDNELEDYPGFEQAEEDSKWVEWDESYQGIELSKLEELESNASGYSPDWNYGSTMIRDSYFEEYAEQLVKDIGDLPDDLPSYIANNIDWKGVAEDLQQDYTEVDFDGVAYWIR